MREPDISFMRRCMRWYYFERFDGIEIPTDMHMREFGYRRINAGMVRHIQIRNPVDLHVLLLEDVPLEVYVSNARYLFPAMPMREKVLENADMIFDIDAHDLDMQCRPSHTASSCQMCGYGTAGPCPRCGHHAVKTASLTCRKCIDAAKDQVKKLLGILADDLGIREGVQVYFSGNEGFHIHVNHEGLASLGSAERTDLIDYVSFQGMLPERLGAYRNKPPSLPQTTEGGWRGRFVREVMPTKAARSRAAKSISAGGYDAFVQQMSDAKKRLGVRIDAGVTMDMHRIFRMPGTINGKSGMAKVLCDDLDSFDPYVSAVVLPDEPATWVRASCPIQFRMKNKQFGPYANEYVQVPAYAAAYMVCKGLASVVK